MKSGIWGSGLDTLLSALRKAISKNADDGFPVAQIEAAMAPQGKSLRFDDDEIDSLLETEYAKRNTFSIIALLYPGHDLRNEFHEDHIFHKSLFRRQRLAAAGLSDEEIEVAKGQVNQLPNLQLLEGIANIQKSAKLPVAWLEEVFADEVSRNAYVAKHDLGTLAQDMKGFSTFFAERRARIAARLKTLLDVKPGTTSAAD